MPPTMTLETFRARFPLLGRRTYVNSCSQGALSLDVERALAAFTESWHTGGSPWDRWVAEVERLRLAAAALLGASPDEVAIMPNASTAIAAIATGLPFDGPRREVVLGGFEFPTVAHVWLAQARRGAVVRWAGTPDDASLPVERYEPCLSERTAIVPVTHVCFRNGYRLDVPRIAARAHEAGALVLLDDYQHTGTSPLDVHALGVDVLVTGTLKYLMGPPGIAILYVRRGLLDTLEPLVTGWFGRQDPFAFRLGPLDWSATARRFETGSPPVPNAYAAVAALDLLQAVGVDAAARRIAHLVDRFVTGARDQGFQVATPSDPERRGALVVLRSSDAPALVERLAARGIIASARGTGLRVSFHAYNDDGDVDAVLAALDTERALLVGV
ncbi:MAG: aminotransferase class V-fold PLP-dependent enzyme [Vicinamibacterales bacterium]